MRVIIYFIFGAWCIGASGTQVVEDVEKMRQVAREVSQAAFNTNTAFKAESVSVSMKIGCHGVSDSGNPEGWEPAKAVARPKADCAKVKNGFLWAKHYWAELICITKNIVLVSSRPYPDLNYLRGNTRRAETLRQWIEQVFPAAWDSQSLEVMDEWKPAEGTIQTFVVDSIDWAGQSWRATDFPRKVVVTPQEGKIAIKRFFSLTSYCLEPRESTLHGRYSGQDLVETAVKVKLE